MKYPFKVAQTTLFRASEFHSVYDKLTGIKIFGIQGLQVKVSLLDFFKIEQHDYNYYEIFSDMNFK
jgi:hypothetical protein